MSLLHCFANWPPNACPNPFGIVRSIAEPIACIQLYILTFTNHILVSTGVWGQEATPYTEASSGITFQSQWFGEGSGFGIVLPKDGATKNATEYIGYYVNLHHL